MLRKLVVLTVSVVLCLVFVSGSFAAKPYEGQRLTVSTWSGPFAKHYTAAIVKPFEEWSGAKVTVVPGWSELVTKIIAAPPDRPPYDVLLGEGRLYTQARMNNLILPLDLNNIPRHKDIYTALKKMPGYQAGYGVPYQGSPVAIVYRPDDVPFTPDSWQDFVRKEVRGHLCLDRNWWFENFFIAAYLMGKKHPTADWIADNLDPIFKTIKTQIAPYIKKWYKGGSDLFAYMDQGEVWMGTYYAGSVYQKIKAGMPIKLVFPKEGTNGYYDYLMVVRGTKKKRLAEAFINFALRPEIQSDFVKRQFNSVSNKYAKVPDDLKWLILDNEEEYNKFSIFVWDKIEPIYKEIDERWNEEILPLAGK
jgi:spermidine/putrescine-binding protein